LPSLPPCPPATLRPISRIQSRTPPGMPCKKTKLRYYFCQHDYKDLFTPCDDHAGDDISEATKEECWESQGRAKRNLSTTMNSTMEGGGVCCRDCDAEFIGFTCCNCGEFIEARDVRRNAENSLIHLDGDTEHEFCDRCITNNFTMPI